MRMLWPSSPSGAYAVLAGALTAAMGALSIAGSLWGAPDGLWIQSRAALALVAAGAGCVLATRGARARLLAAGLGICAAAVGLAALTGYILDHSYAAKGWTEGTRFLHGGLPANTALGCALAGGALVVATRLPALASLFGVLCAALGASGGLGHLLAIGAYGWGASTPMAPAAAACLVLLGSALAAHPMMRAASPQVRLWQLPVLLGLAAAVVTLLLSQALASREEDQLQRLVSAGSRRVRAELRERLDQNAEALSILAREWEDRLLRTRGAWEADVRLLLSRSPGLEAVEWTGADGTRDWIHPRDAEVPALRIEPELRAPPQRALIAAPLRLSDGDPGLRVLAPLVEEHELVGWLAGTFRSRVLFAEMLSGLETQWVVRVEAGGVELFRSGEPSSEGERWTQPVLLDLPGGTNLVAIVQPSPEMVRSARSALPRIVAAGGLVASLLLTLALGMSSIAMARAAALRDEMAERQRAHEEIRRLNVELEDRVRARTAELSKRNEDLRRFASFLSHELRQPLGTLAIWAELLETRHGATLDAEARRYLAEIRANAKRLGDQIEAQLAASSQEPKAEPTDLVRVIREVAGALKPALEEADASLELDELPILRVEAQQVRQLFFNLLENAVKYRRPDVPLRIGIRYESGDPIEIRVEDNGHGFPPAQAERLFAVGERLAQPGVEGHGLGLAICRRVLERHGGTLHAEGRPERGATFRLRFPAELLVEDEAGAH